MTSIKDFRKTLSKELNKYSKVFRNDIEEASKELAKIAVTELKESSPRSNTSRSGQYAKGWGVKKTDAGAIVMNKTDYRLTHLLENGTVRMGSQVHIKPTEERVIEEFEKRIEKLAKG